MRLWPLLPYIVLASADLALPPPVAQLSTSADVQTVLLTATTATVIRYTLDGEEPGKCGACVLGGAVDGLLPFRPELGHRSALKLASARVLSARRSAVLRTLSQAHAGRTGTVDCTLRQ